MGSKQELECSFDSSKLNCRSHREGSAKRAIMRIGVQIPAPKSESSQIPVTQAPKGPTSSSGLSGHQHRHTRAYTHTFKDKNPPRVLKEYQHPPSTWNTALRTCEGKLVHVLQCSLDTGLLSTSTTSNFTLLPPKSWQDSNQKSSVPLQCSPKSEGGTCEEETEATVPRN